MTIKTDLESEVATIYKSAWTRRDGTVIPEDADVKHNNDGVDLDAVILYADLSDSTKLVKNYKTEFAAENYKAFLRVAAKIIRSLGGHIRSYDGDRVMGIFIGSNKNSNAVKAALQIHWAVKNIIHPAIKKQYNTEYVMKHVCGIDATKIMAARSGIRGSSDLVWVGNAANYAAKLTTMDDAYPTWITSRVYSSLSKETKFSGDKNMWEALSWTSMDNMTIYRSNYWWPMS